MFLTPVTPWTVACQSPLSMEFSRPEYWSELLFPTPRDLYAYEMDCLKTILSSRISCSVQFSH